MGVTPIAVNLTSYAGGSGDLMQTPLNELLGGIKAGTLPLRIGKTFKLDEIVEAHRTMESNQAVGKIVVLT